ncbi:MAG: 50S ribosomal protein L10 [Candidatus Diapherotrites archaeon]|uniref:Large ribosomal subunit protein uL10 n=1 Tax=Candidatus Iainarchaeum sp. TaxID=3101447 RepID=A0A8T4KVE6_9ARCH|nr:50S ribosomal protein L10 [Candidatus Diapherotrites archaeon]
MTRHNREWKEAGLQEIKRLTEAYPVVAIADLNMFPASLFQGIRKKLRGKGTIVVSKTRVIKKALQENKKVAPLTGYANKSCAVIFTSMNPFELFSFLKKNKGSMPAKEGHIAEEDIVVPAGDTGLPPGPALSDLKAAGLSVRVQGATIAIAEDKIVTRKGQAVSKPVAGMLLKLNIRPVKVGLSVVSAIEGGQVFEAKILDIDTEVVFQKFASAHRKAFNLAFNACYFTKQTMTLLVQKAFNDSKAVALEAEVFTEETMPKLLAKEKAQADSLKAVAPEVLPEEKKEAKP